MDIINLDNELLQKIKYQYQGTLVYELFKKYQTLLLLKNLLNNNKPISYNKTITITNDYHTIIESINQQYDESLKPYNLYYPPDVNTLSELLNLSENKLNIINILLLNIETYNLDFIDFILPITTCEKLLLNIIVYLYQKYDDLGCQQLYQKYIKPGIITKGHLNLLSDYNETIVKHMNLVLTIKDFLNVKVDDYHKDKSLTQEKKINSKLRKKTETFDQINDDVQQISIEYINCYFQFIGIYHKEELYTVFQEEFPSKNIEILTLVHQNKKTIINIIFDCLELHTLNAINLHKSVSKLLHTVSNNTSILRNIDINYNNIVEFKYFQEEEEEIVEEIKNIKHQINIFGEIEEEMNTNQLLIYKIIMRFYKTTNITVSKKRKINEIIEKLNSLQLNF